MAADLWPSIRWTALAFAPEEIANDAAVWRRSWGVTRGMPGRVAGLPSDTVDLSVVEVDTATHDLALGHHALGRVRNDAAIIDGVFEDGRQHAVGAPDRRGGPVVAERCDPVLD